MRTSLKNQSVAPPLDRAVGDSVAHSATEAEAFRAKLLRARRLYPPPETDCKACWLEAAEAQCNAATMDRFEPVEPNPNRECHRKGWDAGSAAALAILTA